MTITMEIEKALETGVEPMFLIGLMELAKTKDGDWIAQAIDRIATRRYRERNQHES